jgi:hypothetical protein
MSHIYRRAIRVLQQDDAEPLQLMFHIDSVSSDAIPLREALEGDDVELGFQFPQAWLYNCAEMLVLHLRETAKKMKAQLVFSVHALLMHSQITHSIF